MADQVCMGGSGYRMLGYFENGYRHVSNRLRRARSPADLRGMRIRSRTPSTAACTSSIAITR